MNKFLILLLLPLAFSCVTKSESFPQDDGLVMEIMESREVNRGWIEESTEQIVNVYLPPSYESDTEKRYPVIYFLHGFSQSPNQLANRRTFLNSYFKSDESLREFIIVEPNGNSILGGSFYWNSPASGNWESFIVKEVVSVIDRKYRTISQKESRGIAGFSMGGTGAMNIALRNPDMFNAVYAFSAGILADGDMDMLQRSWGASRPYNNSYGAAASPDKSIGEPYAEIPNSTYEDSAENDRVISNWYTVFGNMDEKTSAYLESGDTLAGIGIHANEQDSYQWIPKGSLDLHRILTEKGIEHQFELGRGMHALPRGVIDQYLIPFFTEHLE